jgi:hypothetical protein
MTSQLTDDDLRYRLKLSRAENQRLRDRVAALENEVRRLMYLDNPYGPPPKPGKVVIKVPAELVGSRRKRFVRGRDPGLPGHADSE